MNTEMNLIYDPKEKNYVLLTKKNWEDTLYESHIDLGDGIDEDKIIGEMKGINVSEAKLFSAPIKGYDTVSLDVLLMTAEGVISKDGSLHIIIPEYTTP